VTPSAISDNVEKDAKRPAMHLTVEIPDDIASTLTAAGGDLSRRALEGLALEELRAGRITETQLRKMLGMARIELDGFLKSHGIYQNYTLEDFEQERKTLKDLGL
jgi:hypothetical protein